MISTTAILVIAGVFCASASAFTWGRIGERMRMRPKVERIVKAADGLLDLQYLHDVASYLPRAELRDQLDALAKARDEFDDRDRSW